MTTKRANPDFLNGVPELVILRLLSQQPRYGYELVQAIRDATGESLAFGEGCVYPVLHKLEATGHLTARRQKVAGRSRVVYRVTKAGHAQLARSIATWTEIVSAVQHVLQGGSCGQPALA